MPTDDQDPGWGELNVILWPIRAYVAVRRWVCERLHPSERDNTTGTS